MEYDYNLPIGNLYGLLYPGNIDLFSRPVVSNGSNGISTIKSMSADFGNGEVLYPTIGLLGQFFSPQQATDNYLRTGQNLGTFLTPQHATAYAKALHDQQANWYLNEPLILKRGLFK